MMHSEEMTRARLKKIRILIWIEIVGLFLSGATAIPLETELKWMSSWFSQTTGLGQWIWTIRDALIDTNLKYPYLAYGTDWLAFGHFAIALAFIGPLRDPVRNKWVVDFGLISCVLIIPFALVMGEVRGIPFYWRLIDCSFGIFGAIPLYLARKEIQQLEGPGPHGP
jgi:hypothetical protein